MASVAAIAHPSAVGDHAHSLAKCCCGWGVDLVIRRVRRGRPLGRHRDRRPTAPAPVKEVASPGEAAVQLSEGSSAALDSRIRQVRQLPRTRRRGKAEEDDESCKTSLTLPTFAIPLDTHRRVRPAWSGRRRCPGDSGRPPRVKTTPARPVEAVRTALHCACVWDGTGSALFLEDLDSLGHPRLHVVRREEGEREVAAPRAGVPVAARQDRSGSSERGLNWNRPPSAGRWG